jgi:hypothetical protein
MLRPWVWAPLTVMVWPFAVLAADGDVVEATGEAQVRGGDVVTAKKAATADALRRCVEQVVGISVKSDFSSEQQEIVKNNQDQFYSAVRDSLTQKSEGFIQSHEVVKEAQQGDVMKVTVRAKVFESKVRAEVKKLTDLITAAGNPKLMLVIQEVYISPEGKKRVAKESMVGAMLEKELTSRGFELRGAREAKNVADDSVEQYDKWLDGAGGASKMARDAGADILIAGRIEILNKGVIDDPGALEALRGQVRIEINSIIRGVNVATAEVLSTKPVQMVSIGINEERAAHRAFQGRGNNVVKQTFDDLLEDLKQSFAKTAAQGQSYVVQLKGVTSFRKQGQGFLEALKRITGVSEVKQKSFEGGQLVIDVSFKGSPAELQERVFSITEKSDGLSTLDVEGVSGKQLSFKL